MKEFLSKVTKSATDAANKAGNKASELIEVGKIKAQVAAQKQDAVAVKKEIGEYCFKLYEEGKIEDEKIKEFCARIADINEVIEDLEKQLESVKDEYSAKSSMNSAAE